MTTAVKKLDRINACFLCLLLSSFDIEHGKRKTSLTLFLQFKANDCAEVLYVCSEILLANCTKSSADND